MFVYFFLYSFFWTTRKYLHDFRTTFTSANCHPFVWIFLLFLHCFLYGLSATDNTTCSNASAFFNCTDGLYCIPIAHRCNLAVNCNDGSDEINCNRSGAIHFCTTGYKSSGLDCVDIDECQKFLTCSQICTNTPGSFSCACVQGYALDPVSGTFCKASGPLPYILVSASDSIFSLYPDSDTDTITYFTQFSKYSYLSPLQDVTAIGFHYTKGLVFWSDVSKHGLYVDSLFQTPTDASPYLLISPIIHDMYMRPVSIAVDWVSDKLYWTDDLNGKIEVSGLDGTNRRVLVSGLIKPKSLAIDAEWGYLFFTICDPNEPKILRSNLDGTNMIVLHNSSLIMPNALTVDLPTHTLYWLDAGLVRIERSDATGLNRHVVISDRNQIHNPTSMSIYEDTIYFTDSFIHGVVAVHKDGSWNRQIARRINEASSLQIVFPSAQPDFTYSNPCSVDNGGCSHLCLLSNSSSHSCLCPTLLNHSYSPQLGTATCVYPDQFMLAITALSVRAISLLAPNYMDAQLDIAALANISRLVWDDSTTSLFWISGFDGCIYRYKLGAVRRESQILLQDKLIRITDIAYDWIHSLLFFIDETNKRVEVVSVDNPDRRSVVISHGLIRPRSLVVNPLRGYIAWLDVVTSPDVRPVIMAAGMDGSNRRVLVSHKLLDPTILTVDYRSNYLYWFDKGSGIVERSHLDGTRRGTIMSTRYTVSAFSIYRGDVYWSPEEVERIFRFNPSSRVNTTIMTGLHSISHLSIYHQRNELTAGFNTPCFASQTNCSHICVLRGSHTNHTNSVCMCYNGYELTNRSHCGMTKDLYAVLLQDNDLYYSAVQNSSLHTLIRIRTRNITSLTLDPTDSDVVFISEKSFSGGTIKKVVFDKVSHSIVNTTVLYSHLLGFVSDIAIESRTRLLYWLDSQNGVIGVGSLVGDKRTIVLGQDLLNPKFILLSVNTSSLYWVELRGDASFISRISLDGSNRQRIKTLLGEQITSFALATLMFDGEYVQYLLWTVLSSPNIYCYEIELDFIYFIPTSSSPCSLTIHQSEVYWSSRATNAIYTATLNPGNPPSLTGTRTIFSSELPLSAVVIESYRDRFYSPSPCAQDTPCSYLCLPSSHPQGYSCHCPPGIVSQVDSNCPRLPSRFLLISLHSEIHYVSLDTSYTVPALLHHESGLITGAAVVYAPSETYSALIWSDISSRNRWAIKKMDIGTRAVSVLVRGVFTRGLAVDQETGQLYFTDRFNHSIMVYDLGTDAVKSLARNETYQHMQKPRSLAIDTVRKYLFWSDWGLGTIERSRLDGTERKVIVSRSILEPSGLAIDLVRDRLYWVDYAFKTIESCDYEGMARLTVAHNLSQPYSLTLSYPDLYFTDWTNNTLNRISLLHPSSPYNTTYQSTAIIMDVQFISVNLNPPHASEKTASTSTSYSASTTSQSHHSTTSFLSEYPHKHLFTILYILAALLVLLISALLIALAYMYCNLRRLKRRQTFSPHSILRNSQSCSPQNIAIADAIFSLTNNTSTPQQQTSTQPDDILTDSHRSESSLGIPLKPILTPELSTTLEGAASTASPHPTSSTTKSNSVVSTQDYTPKRSFARRKVCYKLLSKFQEQPEESCLTTPLSSFKYNSLSPSKKNSSQYNSSCF